MTGYVFPFRGAEADDWGVGAGAQEPADYCSREGALALKACAAGASTSMARVRGAHDDGAQRHAERHAAGGGETS